MTSRAALWPGIPEISPARMLAGSAQVQARERRAVAAELRQRAVPEELVAAVLNVPDAPVGEPVLPLQVGRRPQFQVQDRSAEVRRVSGDLVDQSFGDAFPHRVPVRALQPRRSRVDPHRGGVPAVRRQGRIERRRNGEVHDRFGRRPAGGAVGVGGVDARFAAAQPDHAAARQRGISVPGLPLRELVHGRQQLVAAHLRDQRTDPAAQVLPVVSSGGTSRRKVSFRVQVGHHAARRHRRAVGEPHSGGGAALVEERDRLGVRMDGHARLLDGLPHEDGDGADPTLHVAVVRGACRCRRG